MKKLSVLMLIGTLAACAVQTTTTLSFSADFKFALPQSVFAGATVFATDELSVKAASGQLTDKQLQQLLVTAPFSVTGPNIADKAKLAVWHFSA